MIWGWQHQMQLSLCDENAVPEVFVGGLVGGMVVFLFAGMAIDAVGSAAQTVVVEVRTQLSEWPGILTHSQLPDYKR